MRVFSRSLPLVGLLVGLTAAATRAQTQPVPPGQPVAPASLAPAAPMPADDYRLGRSYRIETATGSVFVGTLVSLSLDAIELETKDLGRITVPRANIRRGTDETGGTAVGLAGATALPALAERPGYYDIGNGDRLFFAPTGRGLRRGEGDVNTTNLFLVGGNYGITNNFSLGGYLSLLPGIPLNEQVLVLAPKFSAPLGPKLHAAVGALYANVPFSGQNSGGAGILYGAFTYGTAAANLTAGVGYGLFRGNVGSTPVFQLGGQVRVSRRLSLVSENYFLAEARTGGFGLYGARLNWRRTSLGMGAAYVFSYGYTTTYDTYTFDPGTGMNVYTGTRTERVAPEFNGTYILPVYVNFSYRFGRRNK